MEPISIGGINILLQTGDVGIGLHSEQSSPQQQRLFACIDHYLTRYRLTSRKNSVQGKDHYFYTPAQATVHDMRETADFAVIKSFIQSLTEKSPTDLEAFLLEQELDMEKHRLAQSARSVAFSSRISA